MSTPISNPDLVTIYSRLLRPLQVVPDLPRVRVLVSSLQSDGRWPDVDYENMDTTHWKPIEHLRNALLMAQALRTEGSELHDDADLHDTLFCALDHWLEKDYRRPWWYNAIGITGVLANIMLLIDADLNDARRELGCKILERAILGTTGQNLVWQANITVKRAILERNADLAAKAYDLIAAEIKISKEEGIQHDFSFHQHGDCLYNHGYGAGFARDGSETAVLVNGTRFAFPKVRIDILAGYILDGSQWMIRGQFPEIGAKGREITRRNLNCRYLIEAARNMIEVCPDRADEFEALAASIEADDAPPVRGNRHYWRSDFMAHHRDGWYASARAHSTRMMNTDGLSGCDEGQKSHHISDGANFIYVHGQEYQDIFPVWDWRKIPGTTVVQGDDFSGEPRRRGITDFVGGVSNGTYGTFACDLIREACPLDQPPVVRRDEAPPPEPATPPTMLHARKSWFFFDNEVVALGAGITLSPPAAGSADRPPRVGAGNQRTEHTASEANDGKSLSRVADGRSVRANEGYREASSQANDPATANRSSRVGAGNQRTEHTASEANDGKSLSRVADGRSVRANEGYRETNGPVATTLNQSILHGPVTHAPSPSASPTQLPQGTHALSSTAWVHHDNIAYIFPEPVSATVSAESRTGSWKLIATQASDAAVTADIFTLSIDHGPAPIAAEYTYITVPSISAADVSAYASNISIEILSNTPDLQAVHHAGPGITAAAFYEPGTLTLPSGQELSVNHPCLILLHQSDSGSSLTISDPTTRLVSLTVSITESAAGQSSEAAHSPALPNTPLPLEIALPSGPNAGQSTTVTLD